MQKAKFEVPLNLRFFDAGGPSGATAAAAGQQTGETAVPGAQTVAGEEIVPAAGEKTTTRTTSDTLEARKAEFEKLISGEYKDLFQERTQGIINKRFAKAKAAEEKLNAVSPVLSLLMEKYNVDDPGKLQEAIQKDDQLWEDQATAHGMSVDRYLEYKRMEMENAALKEARREMEEQRHAQETTEMWMRQAQETAALFPGFDLQTEVKNPQFAKLLQSGIDVTTAYKVIHNDELVTTVMQKTAQVSKQKTADDIRARGQRPSENGTSGQSGAVIKLDVSKMTPQQRREIAQRAAMGEQIKF